MHRSLVLYPLLLCLAVPVFANTAIETETAQIGRRGEWTFSQSTEYDKASDGATFGTLTQFEYGISDRAELLIEPFFHEWERPTDGPKLDGPGDLEITPSYMFVKERGRVPAMLLAMKVKVPTGSPNVGGSGKYDYYPYVILGQHYAGWTFNGNIGVNFVNAGSKYDTPFDGGGSFEKHLVFDLEAETQSGSKLTNFIEIYRAEDGIKTIWVFRNCCG